MILSKNLQVQEHGLEDTGSDLDPEAMVNGHGLMDRLWSSANGGLGNLIIMAEESNFAWK